MPWQLGSLGALASLAESNRDVGSLNLHDWCFRLARQAPLAWRSDRGERERGYGRSDHQKE